MDFDLFSKDHGSCSLFKEDLKSEDPNIRAFAVSRLNFVCELIGTDKFVNEMIPIMIQVIEKSENEEDFLIAIMNKIIELKSHFNLQQQLEILQIYEATSTHDEAMVREKAIECIKMLSANQNRFFFQTEYLKLLKRLAHEKKIGSRISACFLFSECYNHLPEEDKIEIRQLFIELASDESALVRRSAAKNLKELIKTDIIPTIYRLMKDEVDSVKINAIENITALFPFLTSSEINDLFITVLKNTDSEVKSWRLRFAFSETIAEFSPFINLDVVRNQIINLYQGIVQDPEPEIRIVGIQKFQKLFLYIADDEKIKILLPILDFGIKDPSFHVRVQTCKLISTFAISLTKEEILKYLLPKIQILLDDDLIEVKLAIISEIPKLSIKFGGSDIKNLILPLFQLASQHRSWRSRLAMAETITSIIGVVDYSIFSEGFEELVFGFFHDHYYEIRQKAISLLKELIEVYGYQIFANKLKNLIEVLLHKKNYLFRITGIDTVIILFDFMDNGDSQTILRLILERMADEKVWNVKNKAIQMVERIFQKLKSHSSLKLINSLLSILSNDDEMKLEINSVRKRLNIE